MKPQSRSDSIAKKIRPVIVRAKASIAGGVGKIGGELAGKAALEKRIQRRKGVRSSLLAYSRNEGVDVYIRKVRQANPLQIIELERAGVQGSFIKDLSARMQLPTSRLFGILGVPKATAERKAASGKQVTGSGGQAAIAMTRLVSLAQDIVANSTAEGARGFDAARWLGAWIDRPQPALGGRRPADVLDTPTGFEVVARLLGAIESSAYQ